MRADNRAKLPVVVVEPLVLQRVADDALHVSARLLEGNRFIILIKLKRRSDCRGYFVGHVSDACERVSAFAFELLCTLPRVVQALLSERKESVERLCGISRTA